MAFAAVTILMDTLHQNFLQPKPRFILRNKKRVTSLFRNLCFLQTSLEEDSKVGKYDEAMKVLEAQLRDDSIEIRFQIEQQLRLFYLGKAMEVRLESARKLLPILNRQINDIETLDFSSMLDTLLKHFTLPVSCMPPHIKRRVKSFCTEFELYYSNDVEQKKDILLEAKSLIIRELRASYLKKYKKQRIEARQRLRQVFTLGIKLTRHIKKRQLKVKNANDQSRNFQKHNSTSPGGLERENITVGGSMQHTIKMVGCDDEFNTLMDKLNRQSLELEIVSIVGMGGIGKTTLARRIYGDASMISHFDCRAWVTVSQEYNPTQVFRSLLHSLCSGNNEISEASNDPLDEKIYRCLKRQRYLIVIDDIWSTHFWGDLRKCFPDDNNGSRMLLTTRLKHVAEYAYPGGNSYHNMRFLYSDESWNLFHNKMSERIIFSPEFETIAKEIVEKCKGLPLAIIVAAGLLSNSKQTFDEWENIAKNVSTLSLDHFDQQCANILNLSYTFLPHHLKLCFLLFGVFPEDYEVRVNQIVFFWLSEGFLKVVKSKSLEDVARESIQDLINRNLVQICSEMPSGKINGYQMHDVLRELALREARKENLLCCQEDDEICLRHRRARPKSFSHKAQQWTIQFRIRGDSCLNHLRNFSSVFWFLDSNGKFPSCPFSCSPSLKFPSNLVDANFKLLRVLIIDVIELNSPSFFTEIMGLVHLRFLVFRTNLNIKFLPWFMLWNLHYLQVYNSITWELLGVCELPQVRHIHFNRITLVPPRSVQNHLEVVSWLDYRSCTKELFMRIPNLMKLEVCDSEIYSECEDCNWFESLVYLYKLQELAVAGKIIHGGFRTIHSVGILSLENFLPNLKSLRLYSTELEWKDMDVVGTLPKLEVLELEYAVNGSIWEPKDGGFCRLKFLGISNSDLQYWEATSDHFPVIERLVLSRCWMLEEIPSCFAEIATLQLIKLDMCSSSVRTSAENIREEQQGFGNDTFVLHID